MRLYRLPLLLSVALNFGCASIPASAVSPRLALEAAAGTYPVATAYATWDDAARRRTIPVKLYFPASGAGPFPIIVFSHGLGNSREGYRYLGELWASHGFVSVHPEHPGAATAVARRGLLALYRAGWDKRLWKLVPGDIRFVIDMLGDDSTLPAQLRGRIDLGRIGVGGHSLGAYTAMAIGGLNPFGDPAASPRDPRVRAALALSMSEDVPESAYASVEIPVMHMTGTSDTSLLYGTTTAKRRIPFEAIHGPDQILVTLRGANHSTFSDDSRRDLPAARVAIEAGSLLFWNAYLKGDDTARRELRDGGFARDLDGIGRVEVK
jgi:predicted dienelactone hydrolase